MSDIEERFRALKQREEGALIGYITAGLPSIKDSFQIAKALVEGGVDILELGIPFSDPIADGRTLQFSNYLALKRGVKPKMVLELSAKVKDELKIPLAILSYFNPIYKIGVEEFLALAKDSKVDGLIIPDLPIDEGEDYVKLARKYSIDTIFLAAPNTSEERLHRIVDSTRGFLYLISLYGVTGEREKLADYTLNLIKSFSWVKSKVNLAVGFGVSNSKHIKELIRAGVDGVIVGSAFMKIVNEGKDLELTVRNLEDLAKDLKEGTRFKDIY
ncbi:MAG: tryptophan synthase subunit alpha [Nitrososphaerales archaeon]